MTTATTTATTRGILALDPGKYKRVARVFSGSAASARQEAGHCLTKEMTIRAK